MEIGDEYLWPESIPCIIPDDKDIPVAKFADHSKESQEYREKLSKKIDEELKKYNIDLIVLAGYLSIVDSNFISKWKNKIINIHPSLLPKFGGKGMYGMKVHEAVIKNKEKESGCTVHYVTEMVDGGDIIMQNKVDVLEDDTPEILQKRVLVEEHKILPATVIKLASQSHTNK